MATKRRVRKAIPLDKSVYKGIIRLNFNELKARINWLSGTDNCRGSHIIIIIKGITGKTKKLIEYLDWYWDWCETAEGNYQGYLFGVTNKEYVAKYIGMRHLARAIRASESLMVLMVHKDGSELLSVDDILSLS